MAGYFSYFPKTQHDLTGDGNFVSVTNILKRFKFRSNLLNNAGNFYDYVIQNGDRPDTLAHKYYGNSKYAWVIILFNNIKDPIFDWPLFDKQFDDNVKGKYGSISSAQAQVHEYRIFINQKSVRIDGSVVDDLYYVVDQNTYNSYSGYKESVSKWDYEVELNDKRRNIKILDDRFLNQLKDEVDTILGDI